MGVLGLLTGWDQDQAATNAVLANHLWARLDSEQKRIIIKLIVYNHLKNNNRRSIDDIIYILNEQCRVTQMNFVALACRDLGIEPPIDDRVGWRNIRNPYSVGGHTKKRDISAVIRWFARNKGVSVDWPGDNVKIDFLSWYQTEDNTLAQARRGGDAQTQCNVDAKPPRAEPAKSECGENIERLSPSQVNSPRTASACGFVDPTGRTVEVDLPFNVKDGTQIRLRGLGIPGMNGGEPGDALVTVKIALVDEAPPSEAKYDDLPADDPEAARLFIKLVAQRGDAEAQYNLARFYKLGRGGLPKDKQEAERLLSSPPTKDMPRRRKNSSMLRSLTWRSCRARGRRTLNPEGFDHWNSASCFGGGLHGATPQ